jgi:hypothetical protein
VSRTLGRWSFHQVVVWIENACHIRHLEFPMLFYEHGTVLHNAQSSRRSGTGCRERTRTAAAQFLNTNSPLYLISLIWARHTCESCQPPLTSIFNAQHLTFRRPIRRQKFPPSLKGPLSLHVNPSNTYKNPLNRKSQTLVNFSQSTTLLFQSTLFFPIHSPFSNAFPSTSRSR